MNRQIFTNPWKNFARLMTVGAGGHFIGTNYDKCCDLKGQRTYLRNHYKNLDNLPEHRKIYKEEYQKTNKDLEYHRFRFTYNILIPFFGVSCFRTRLIFSSIKIIATIIFFWILFWFSCNRKTCGWF